MMLTLHYLKVPKLCEVWYIPYYPKALERVLGFLGEGFGFGG